MKVSFSHQSHPVLNAPVAQSLSQYVKSIVDERPEASQYNRPEMSLFLGDDVAYHAHIKKVCEALLPVDDVVLVGTGGSSLGTEAVYAALTTQTSAKLHTFDAMESSELARIDVLFDRLRSSKKLAVVIISKSGGTIESMVNASYIAHRGVQKFGKTFWSRVLCVGSENTSFLDNARSQNIHTLPIPVHIGGRFSVCTAVGIAPLYLLGIDVDAFLEGARTACSKLALSQSMKHATVLFQCRRNKFSVVNFFVTAKRLTYLGMWYRQLLAESVGKSETLRGKPASSGLLPIVSSLIDLHSSTQLYLSGFGGIYTRFVDVPTSGESITIPTEHLLTAHMPFIHGKNLNQMARALHRSVYKAYAEKKLPHSITSIGEITPFTLGQYMNMLMLETMCYAHLAHINPFDQPAVELYKKHFTKALKQR